MNPTLRRLTLALCLVGAFALASCKCAPRGNTAPGKLVARCPDPVPPPRPGAPLPPPEEWNSRIAAIVPPVPPPPPPPMRVVLPPMPPPPPVAVSLASPPPPAPPAPVPQNSPCGDCAKEKALEAVARGLDRVEQKVDTGYGNLANRITALETNVASRSTNPPAPQPSAPAPVPVPQGPSADLQCVLETYRKGNIYTAKALLIVSRSEYKGDTAAFRSSVRSQAGSDTGFVSWAEGIIRL